MQDAAVFWDKVSAKYAKAAISDEAAYELTLGKTRGYLNKTDRVLEVGCGTGSTALLLAPDVGEIIASDLSGKMLEIGQENAKKQAVSNISFLHADVLGGALDAEPCDAVLAFNVLHLLDDAPAAVKKISGLLKPGGLFISKTVSKFGKNTPLKWRLMKLVLPLLQMIGKAPYVNLMAVHELEDLISDGGFQILESGNYPETHMSRYIVARKV